MTTEQRKAQTAAAREKGLLVRKANRCRKLAQELAQAGYTGIVEPEWVAANQPRAKRS